jgi:alkaline phosphatase D
MMFRGPIVAQFVRGFKFNRWLLGLAVLLAALLPAGVWAAPRAESGRFQGGAGPVVWLWSGAVTPTSVRVTAHLNGASGQVRLAVSPNPDLSNPLYSAPAVADAANNNTVTLGVGGLNPDTTYYYAVEVDGVLDTAMTGQFRTFPSGAASFRFVFSADANRGSNRPVFDAIRQENALFYMNIGDFYYADITTNDIDLYRQAYFDTLTASRQQALYQAVPSVYLWDDHDYGANDSDSTSPSREAARLAYQENVPHYPLPDLPANHPDCTYADPDACRSIQQSFAVGRVYVILTDLRSERDPKTQTDDSNKSMLGAVQKQWFKDQLLFARDNYELIFWVSSVPWIETTTAGSDRWGGYATERQELADFIRDNGVENLIILAADAHMLALDDGSNSDYASGGGAPLPVIHAAALHRNGSVKGGPYSHGSYPNPSALDGQYGVIEVSDAGNEVCVSYTGKRLPDGDATPVDILTWSACTQPVTPTPAIASTGNDVTLSWADDPANCRYEVFRSQTPYFDPNGLSPAATVQSPTDPTQVTFAGDAGDPAQNHYYLVRALTCLNGNVADSVQQGEFDFALTPGQ